MPAGFVTPSVCGRHGPATWRLENFTRAGGSSVAGTVQHHHLEDTSHLLTSLSLCPRFLPLVRRLTLTLTSAVGERQEGPPFPREESWSTKGVMVGVITLTLWLWHRMLSSVRQTAIYNKTGSCDRHREAALQDRC